MGVLPEVSEKNTIIYDYFPTTWQTVIWRNWGYVPAERIAKVLDTTEEVVRDEAERLGLFKDQVAEKEWLTRGYLTIIRNNWMICTYEQIMGLLDITDAELAFILKEDDFMWVKMGNMKPKVEAPRYVPLTTEEIAKTNHIRKLFQERFVAGKDANDNAFAFLDAYTKPVSGEVQIRMEDTDHIRFIYPYFALYGDALIDENIDPFPESLLAEYAKVGINGVWMQGVLYQLVEFPFDKTLSEGYEKRIETLKKLVERAKKYGIGIYLYFNEPRAMGEAFYEKYPHLRGEAEGDFYAMCTSTKEVQEYLYQGMKSLFEQVPELAGFFTITMSENLTNCYSRAAREVTCPRCSKRNPWEVVAEVNNLLARGAHAGNPNAKAIVWTWGWRTEWADKAITLLTEKQIVQCTSEEAMPFNIGGVEGQVIDYTISLCGPGEKAKKLWREAKATGHEMSAKVQLNNSWELATVPFIPVFDKIAEHVTGLKEQGIKHLQSSWTLGGCPSPILKFASYLMEGKGNTESFMRECFGERIGEIVNQAQQKLSKAFSEFPFHINVLYYAPQNFGPIAPFFLKNTDYQATMIGFPFDDIDKWRKRYPKEVLESQFQKLCLGWKEGLEILSECDGLSEEAQEILLIAEACYCHFLSAYHHVAFINARGEDATKADEQQKHKMLEVIKAEMENVQRLMGIRLKDSRIGYESSSHYFYSLQDLKEKMINLVACERAF